MSPKGCDMASHTRRGVHVGVKMGDVIYIVGTGLQLVAFMQGMRPTTLGAALIVYGVGLCWFSSRWN